MPASYHMTPQEFRHRGHETVEWIARYMERVEDFPVLSRVEPGEVRRALPPLPPDRGEPFEAVLRDLDTVILPGITHWQSPSFFGYFPANSSGPSILGELLSAGLGVQGMLWSTSPACTELETHVLDWLVDLCALPDRFRSTGAGGGVIEDSASSAVLCAVVAARERVNAKGRPVGVYASSQAHSSVEKAVRVAGLGADALRLIEVDGSYALRPEDLARRIDQDREAGVMPCLAVATVGTTSSGAIDPVPAIGELCRREGIWLHVDAAMSGTAAVCPEFRFLNQGLELADSYCFNPHKWMFVNFDCDAFYVADRKALIGALSVLPEYLRNRASESGAVIDYRDWQIPLGRRFRALKLWLTIRHYGIEGLRHHVREHVRLGAVFADAVRDDERFEVVAPVPLNLVCFRLRGGDEANQRLMDRLNSSGELFLTHTRLDGRLVLRLSIGAARTEQRHVELAWEAIRRAADDICA